MPTDITRRKQVLFVDDDPKFLANLRELFESMSGGSWEIRTAGNHAQALEILGQRSMDVIVLDIGMPGVDGVQFLRLLGRTHPGQTVVMLTGLATEANRKACQEGGAALFLEKPAARAGFESIYAALDALAGAAPQSGFRGMMRRVGLQDVLQMECLGRKSSVLEVFTGKVHGRIYICDGSIVHSESGSLQGEVALYGLLALRGGEFNLVQYTEPPRRTIAGHYEFLLMEAARLSDEAMESAANAPADPSPVPAAESAADEAPAPNLHPVAPAPPPEHTTIEEVVLCSGAGETLYEWECKALDRRLRLLAQIEQQGEQLSGLGPLGRFDRLEMNSPEGRIVCQVQPHLRIFVRSRGPEAGNP